MAGLGLKLEKLAENGSEWLKVVNFFDVERGVV
jgi:hypothetical protein